MEFLADIHPDHATDFQGYISYLNAGFKNKYDSLHRELIDYKHKASYWEAQFNQVKSREELLREELEETKAQLRKREQQLFGKKSEKSNKTSDQLILSANQSKPKKKRGQQVGSQGHGRRDYSHLPVVEERVSFAEENACCPCCGLPYEALFEEKKSTILEVVHVRPYCRVIHRKCYKRHCECKENMDSRIVSAPITERLIPKSKLGISIWSLLIINKYKYQQPLSRTLAQLAGNGLSLSMGTVVDGLQKLLPLLIPVYAAIEEKSISAKHWHADETGWKVFEAIEEKKNNKWFLWIFHNKETVVFKMSPTRSSKVLVDYFGQEHSGGTLNVDRYSAYKVIAKAGLFILAFCWAHVRRDFLDYAKGYPEQESWALSWVEKIGNLYHINNQRIACEEKSKEFRHVDSDLKKSVIEMQKDLIQQQADNTLLPSQKKLLTSLKKHWEGLTIFVDRPEIPMDNNLAERGLRNSVLGRKNYYGSGAIWSAELSAALYTLFETLKLWKLNEHAWLLNYFFECALLGGKPPEDVDRFLPWHMTEEQKKLLSQPPPHQNIDQ